MEEDELVDLGGEWFVIVANNVGSGDALTKLGGLAVHRDRALLDQLVSLASRHAECQRHEFIEALGG